VDTLSPERRSALMKRVKRADTKPEVTLRKELHRLGLRYVIGDKRLPGTPDLVFPKYKAVVFVHGCFWHGHDCRQGRAPTSNTSYWAPKLAANRERDARKEQALRDLGWRVFTVWECQLRPRPFGTAARDLAHQIKSSADGDQLC
jgi:DNA mismatch endonuclease (patch repair protein)